MSLSPFTKQQLIPQEEKLEIARYKSELFIGLPKETSFQEQDREDEQFGEFSTKIQKIGTCTWEHQKTDAELKLEWQVCI